MKCFACGQGVDWHQDPECPGNGIAPVADVAVAMSALKCGVRNTATGPAAMPTEAKSKQKPNIKTSTSSADPDWAERVTNVHDSVLVPHRQRLHVESKNLRPTH